MEVKEDRVLLVANLLAENRRKSMRGLPTLFNNEAILGALIMPDWMIRNELAQAKTLCDWKSLDELLLEVQGDIDRFFPGQFDWKNQRRVVT